ncbi:MAG: thioesterase family protein [Candidatus Thermoplasmatota archaeon]|nr:thioesterase family protein [Candidatus Thermoplasmatota archaeon]
MDVPELKPGIVGEHRLKVTEDKCASRDFLSPDIFVFATPEMIRAMEFASIKACLPHLPPGWKTVGTMVNVKHIKSTPLSQEVVALGELIKVDGAKLLFRVEARDEEGIIGKGEHGRYIINLEQFLAGTKKK